jgi:hypothetical protein
VNAARVRVVHRKGLYASCACLSLKLEKIIVREKHQQSVSERVFGTITKGFSNMISFGELAIVARPSDKKIIKKQYDRDNTVILIGYSDMHEKDDFHFMNVASLKTLISSNIIGQYMTYSSTWKETMLILYHVR